MRSPDWSGDSGDTWARRWRDTDRALAPIGQALDSAILHAAPEGAFRALDVGCGPGTTSLTLAGQRPDATIVGCDLSGPLIAIAEERLQGFPGVRVLVQDAEQAARQHGPFELIFSRHGVMFFADPHRAFATLRSAAGERATLVFSCFQAWEANPWAAELASAAAARSVPSPGREPSGFAFAEPDYVRDILTEAGWSDPSSSATGFDYVAGEGAGAAEEALSFLAELGPGARLMETMDDEERAAALCRMREVIEGHHRDGRVTFPAAAWIWTANAS